MFDAHHVFTPICVETGGGTRVLLPLFLFNGGVSFYLLVRSRQGVRNGMTPIKAIHFRFGVLLGIPKTGSFHVSFPAETQQQCRTFAMEVSSNLLGHSGYMCLFGEKAAFSGWYRTRDRKEARFFGVPLTQGARYLELGLNWGLG